MSQFWIEQGDATEALKLIPNGSVDALVTDPPAGISFMGREWDGAKGGRDKWIAWLAGILRECLRTMKSGAYGWVWALPRTAHWTATACEDAGFAVRDVLVHVFGTGFPKSRALLKPAAEHWILIKAPGELQELRIDECRIAGIVPKTIQGASSKIYGGGEGFAPEGLQESKPHENGRWPANFALSHSDECEMVGTRKIKGDKRPPQDGKREGGFADVGADKGDGKPCGPLYGDSEVNVYRCADGCPVKTLDGQSGGLGKGLGIGGDSGGASRFFYQAKPSTKERSAGLPDGRRNTHTTVKSIALMRHLINLIAQPGGLILDPFTGSGSTGVAALANGCRFVGVEREAEYVEIARQRVYAASQKP